MFGLKPESIVARVKESGNRPRIPSLQESLWRGTIGFTLVSLGGFLPWVLASGTFYRRVGEGGLYAVCAVVFVVLSGLLLHRLIIGPGSLARFYGIFSLAFVGYSIAWTAGWMLLRGHIGSLAGLFAGTAVMGALFACGFGICAQMWKVIAVLFVTNTLGYFVGGWAYESLGAQRDLNLFGVALDRSTRSALAKAAWGLFYGVGFGAGIGAAFYLCQERARRLLRESAAARD